MVVYFSHDLFIVFDYCVFPYVSQLSSTSWKMVIGAASVCGGTRRGKYASCFHLFANDQNKRYFCAIWKKKVWGTVYIYVYEIDMAHSQTGWTDPYGIERRQSNERDRWLANGKLRWKTNRKKHNNNNDHNGGNNSSSSIEERINTWIRVTALATQ